MSDMLMPVPAFVRVRALAFTLFVLAFAAAGCGGGEPAEPAVATPALSLGRDRAAIGSPLTLTYRFELAPDAKIDGDYTVFVHVLDPEAEQLWTDDHQPPVPTSRWKPGEKVEYSRTVFVPNYPYIGPATIRLGLYNPATSKRLVLNGQEVSRREYKVADLQLLPQSENIFLIFKEGWHPTEVSAANPNVEWQWTTKSATVAFKNPRKDATFYIEYAARTDRFDPPQQVTVRTGDQVIGTFTADSKDPKLVTMPVSAAQLGAPDVAEIVIDVDRTFVPGGNDSRELGIQVFHSFIEPK